MPQNKVILTMIVVLSLFGGFAHADEGDDDADLRYCQGEARQAGINKEDALNAFVADCLRDVKICEEEAYDADLGDETEIRNYITQCMEEFRMSETPDPGFGPDMDPEFDSGAEE